MRELTLASAVVLLLSVVAGRAWGTVPYVITDLGALGGTGSYASGVNNAGQVVGYAYTSGGVWNAFRTEAKQPIHPATDGLGTFGGTCSWAYAINNGGQAVGYAYTSGGAYQAFRTEANQPINPATDDLGTLGGAFSVADGINGGGQVVGDAYTSGGAVHAFRTEANQPIHPATDDLGTLGGIYSYASGINDAGQVVGYAYTSGGAAHAFRTEANQPIHPATDDLGTLGGTESYGSDVNNAGQVVGYAYTSSGAAHAFRTEANQPIHPATDDLGTLGGTASYATGINNSGQVVGYAYTSSGASDAFLYSGSGPMQDLNSLIAPASGWTLEEATGINDSGQIVGYGVNSSGEEYALLLTSALPGDANLDGQVDINDLTIVLANFGKTTGMSWETGDFNGDGKVDINDLTSVLTNFGQSLGSSITGPAAVPEPSCLGLLVLAAIGLAAPAWRRRGAFPKVTTALAVLFAALSAGVARADVFDMPAGDVSLQTVFVGNAGNGNDPKTGDGAVDYDYQMGEFDVTDAQYCQFLNAKLPTISNPATTTMLPGDTYGLYCLYMMTAGGGIDYNPAAPTGDKFSVSPGYQNLPVQYVSWYDAIRFANWLQNGQGNGSTESGTYTITGGGQNSGTVTIPSAASYASWTTPHWVLPTENEWYKAAYYDPNKPGGAGYWTFPTQSDTTPSNVLDPTGADNANFNSGGPTPVGTFMASPGPYGTFDQGGDVWQFSQAAGIVQGGAFYYWVNDLNSVWCTASVTDPASNDYDGFGFRLTYAQRTVLPGDANGDGKVDINDLTIVLANYGQTGMVWSQGDFIGDGKVDVNDLTIVLANYGQSIGSSATGMAAVPEPSILVLLAAAALVLLNLGWRGNSRARKEKPMPRWRTLFPVALAFVFCEVHDVSAQAHYTLLDLGGLGESGVYPYAINGTGQIAGWCYTLPNDYPHAFSYSDGTMRDLGTLGGNPQAQDSFAFGINDSGQIAGASWDSGGNTRAFLDSNGTMQDLGTLGGTSAGATALNDSGEVVGSSTTIAGSNQPSQAFLYSGGTMQDLGTLGGPYSAANAINNSGQVVGWASYSNYYGGQAFLYSGGTMHDLGTLGTGAYSSAYGINDTGQVVGTSYINSGNIEHAFLYSSGTMQDLTPAGSTGSEAWAINDAGQVVGDADGGAFIYSGGTTTYLNSLISPALGLVLETARAINDQGWIVGWGYAAADRYKNIHGYLLKPAQSGDANLDGKVDVNDLTIVLTNFGMTGMSWSQGDFNGDGKVDVNDLTIVLTNFGKSAGVSAGGMAAVPEPSMLALLVAALLGLLACAWRKRK